MSRTRMEICDYCGKWFNVFNYHTEKRCKKCKNKRKKYAIKLERKAN